ncbi:MAG: hypothetical protein HY560_00995 [Gemmatimonadetes bacterium]|nr:hypothetical protein [Gemmatimonadota bacterium]
MTQPAIRGAFVGAALVFGPLQPVGGQQIPDARLIPPGVLRVSFTPQYQSWDRVFDEDGREQLLGRYYSSDTAGADLFPTLLTPQKAVRAITGDSSYRLSLGVMRTMLDADIRRFPFDFSLGLTKWLTLAANLPIVVTRMNATLLLDSTTGNVGWNQAATESGNALGRSAILSLLGRLGSVEQDLDARIATGQFGCPTSATCTQARDLRDRVRALQTSLTELTGVPTGVFPAGLVLPPAAPLATSPAGSGIRAAVERVKTDLSSLGLLSFTDTMSLPSKPLAASDVQTMLTSSSFGYEGGKFEYTKRWGLGDAEAGLRLGLVQTAKARIMVYGTARLPTGIRDSPNNFIDIGRGDRQTDLVAGLDIVLDPGPVSLALAGWYTWQLRDRLIRRLTPPEQPIAPASTAYAVKRDLGDVVWAGAYPSLRLSSGFRVYASGTYYRKRMDRFELDGQPSTSPPLPPDVLERRTEMRALSFGGGVTYRSEPRGGGLPVEAGLHYQAAYNGSGGFTPKSTVLTMYLRAFYHLWGNGSREPGAESRN